MVPGIHYITLGVADVAAATAFYERLGLSRSPASQEAISFFQLGPVILGLFGRQALAEDVGVDDRPTGFGAVTLAWNQRCETDVDAAFAKAIAAGGTALKPPQKVFWGGYSGYFADPDGHIWEIAYNPFLGWSAEGHPMLGG